MNRLEKVLYTGADHAGGRHAGMSRPLQRHPRGQAVADRAGHGRRHQPGAALRGRLDRVLRSRRWSSPRATWKSSRCRPITRSTPRSTSVPKGVPSVWRLASMSSLPGIERATAQRLVEAAHEVCAYSRATHGNIAVETTLV